MKFHKVKNGINNRPKYKIGKKKNIFSNYYFVPSKSDGLKTFDVRKNWELREEETHILIDYGRITKLFFTINKITQDD